MWGMRVWSGVGSRLQERVRRLYKKARGIVEDLARKTAVKAVALSLAVLVGVVLLVDVLLLFVAAAGIDLPSLAYRVPGAKGFTYYSEPLLVAVPAAALALLAAKTRNPRLMLYLDAALFTAVLLAMSATSLAFCTFCAQQCHEQGLKCGYVELGTLYMSIDPCKCKS